MKQTLRLRGGLCPKPKPIIYYFYTIFLTFTVLLVSCVCSVAQVSASSPEAGPAAGAVEAIKPLKIGDTIPDALWNLPLQQVKTGQEGSTTVTLNDYKGKLIILDFWATWCGNCIKAIPRIRELEERFENEIKVLPITMEEAEKTRVFITTHRNLKSLNINSVVGDSTLKEYFPHRIVPHTVWIGQDKKVVNVTGTADMTFENIELALNQGAIQNHVKIDVDLNQPLYSSAVLPEHQAILYSVFIKGFQTGLPRGNKKRRVDEKVVGLAMYNKTITEMYQSLYYFMGKSFKKKDIKLDVPDPSAMLFTDDNFKSKQWRDESLYTYELTLPDVEAKNVYEKMIETLNWISGYKAMVINDMLVISANSSQISDN